MWAEISHLNNRTLAVATARGEEVLVVLLTVRFAISLEETAHADLCTAHHTHKVFWMPHLTQSCDHLHYKDTHAKELRKIMDDIGLYVCLLYLPCDDLAAGCTVAFGSCADPHLLHVWAKRSQQVVYGIHALRYFFRKRWMLWFLSFCIFLRWFSTVTLSRCRRISVRRLASSWRWVWCGCLFWELQSKQIWSVFGVTTNMTTVC